MSTWDATDSVNPVYADKIVVVNRRIAIEPPPASVQTEVKHGFALVSQKTSLTPLKVIFGNENYRPGWIVYVSGETAGAPWTKRVYEVEGKKFVLAPEDAVVLVERS